jgi:hypothetical protein
MTVVTNVRYNGPRVSRLNIYIRLYSFDGFLKHQRCMTSTPEKKCKECGIPIRGRTDKVFCADHCRNAFNNRLNADIAPHMRNTNNVLRRNRRILIELSRMGNPVRREMLVARGFDFNHFTSLTTTKTGEQFFYCYEQGYVKAKKGYFRLVVDEDH